MASENWIVSKEESGTKLVQFLQMKLGNEYSLKKLKQALDRNCCLLNGRIERFATRCVGWGDRVVFHLDIAQPPSRLLTILYQDADFLCIDKPSGVSSDSQQIIDLLKAKGLEGLSLAHRLDKETSGVLAFSKTLRGKKALYDLFKERKIEKSYLAIVAKKPTMASGHIEGAIGMISELEGQKIYGVVPKEKGLWSITDWNCLKRGNQTALLLCHPLTGRTHQIRVHLASIGLPIVGDRVYNNLKNPPDLSRRCLLHAAELAFIHPFTSEKVTVKAPLPADFEKVLIAEGISP